jgi:3-phenylpropionate/trans-cinnamate dioxygenase ferredoxin component
MTTVPIGSVEDFDMNTPKRVTCAAGKLCVIKTAGGFYVLDDGCSHETASLSEGEFYDDDLEIECPLHASTFAVDSGEPSAPPATVPVKVWTVSVVDGQVHVEA